MGFLKKFQTFRLWLIFLYLHTCSNSSLIPNNDPYKYNNCFRKFIRISILRNLKFHRVRRFSILINIFDLDTCSNSSPIPNNDPRIIIALENLFEFQFQVLEIPFFRLQNWDYSKNSKFFGQYFYTCSNSSPIPNNDPRL